MVKPPTVAASADELVAGATSRTVVHPGDARSGSTFEFIELGGERYFLKTVSYADDWIMRVTHDRDHRTFKIWTRRPDATCPFVHRPRRRRRWP